MRCINCPYHSRVLGQDWCDIGVIPKRISEEDARKDLRCGKYERKKRKKVDE